MNATENQDEPQHPSGDTAPGVQQGSSKSDVASYSVGLILAAILTAASFWAVDTRWIWTPAIPIALSVLAVAQMGVHLVFFLRLSTSPDSTNTFLALMFGLLIVILVVGGSLWIMANLNFNMMVMPQATATIAHPASGV